MSDPYESIIGKQTIPESGFPDAIIQVILKVQKDLYKDQKTILWLDAIL